MYYPGLSRPLLAPQLTTPSKYSVQLFSLKQEVYCQASSSSFSSASSSVGQVLLIQLAEPSKNNM